MSKFADHCQESIRLFGDSYEEVHRWLDEFQGTERYRMRHRRVRHHQAGIREAVKLFGEQTGFYQVFDLTVERPYDPDDDDKPFFAVSSQFDRPVASVFKAKLRRD